MTWSVSFYICGCCVMFDAIHTLQTEKTLHYLCPIGGKREDNPMTHWSMKHELHRSPRDSINDKLPVCESTYEKYSRWSSVHCVGYIYTERPLHNGPADPNFGWLHPVRTRHPQRSHWFTGGNTVMFNNIRRPSLVPALHRQGTYLSKNFRERFKCSSSVCQWLIIMLVCVNLLSV